MWAGDVVLPCRIGPADRWFSDCPEDVEFARAACGRCPIRRPCLLGALEREEVVGIWGGELFRDGQPVPGPRRNGRPPKDAPVRDRQQWSSMRERIEVLVGGG